MSRPAAESGSLGLEDPGSSSSRSTDQRQKLPRRRRGLAPSLSSSPYFSSHSFEEHVLSNAFPPPNMDSNSSSANGSSAALSPPVPESLPPSFPDTVAFLNSWAPLLIAETQAELVQSLRETLLHSSSGGGGDNRAGVFSAVVPDVATVLAPSATNDIHPWGSNWRSLTVKISQGGPAMRNADDMGSQSKRRKRGNVAGLREGTISVLFWHSEGPSASAAKLPGIITHYSTFSVTLAVAVPAQSYTTQLIERMRFSNSQRRVGSLVLLSTLVSKQREWNALLSFAKIASQCGRSSDGAVEADPRCVQLFQYILNPEAQTDAASNRGSAMNSDGGAYDQAREPAAAPDLPESIPKSFRDYIANDFNAAQQAAIKVAVSTHSAGTAAPVAARKSLLNGRRGSLNSTQPKSPVALIQGPPGTGKTHCVIGILNALHLQQVTQHQQSLVAKLRTASRAPPRPNTVLKHVIANGLLEEPSAGATAPVADAKAIAHPRILVCCPSNAAVDELVARLLRQQFRDGTGNSYAPPLVRIGEASGGKLSDEAKRISADCRSLYLLAMSEQDRIFHGSNMKRQVQMLEHEMHAVISNVEAVLASEVDENDEKAIAQALDNFVLLSNRVADIHSRHARSLEEFDLLSLTAEHIQKSGIGVASLEQCKDSLEEAMVSHAHIVLTTLSGAARSSVQRAAIRHKGFHTVVVDEAAQASELATLQPLLAGAHRLILVGDPQQLPATVLSRGTAPSSSLAAEQQHPLERSLFERLSLCGVPVLMLTTQYRMAPEIREFPSRFFYNDRLEDDASIARRPPEVWITKLLPWDQQAKDGAGPNKARRLPPRILRPLVFLDVTNGKHSRDGSGSLQNEIEAQVVTALIAHLRASSPVESVDGRIGVLTPYQLQNKLLRKHLQKYLGLEVADRVSVSTVDGFQGQERDIIILSCVRAAGAAGGGRGSSKGGHGSVGFVADVRRMNVALTRAKTSLFVVGSLKALRVSHSWCSFIEHVTDRDAIVHNADQLLLHSHKNQ